MTVNAELIQLPEQPPMVAHAGNEPPQSYMQGFDGASVQPFDKKIADILLAPIDPMDVEIKPDGIVYAPGEWYRSRLTDAFGPGGWALMPRGTVRTRSAGRGGELVVYHGALYCLGRYVSEAHGECTYWPSNAGMTYGDAIEGATTNCVDRCCKRGLGMARELFNKTWRDRWIAKYAEKNREGKWVKRAIPTASGAGPANGNATSAKPSAKSAATAPASAKTTAAPSAATSSAPAAPATAATAPTPTAAGTSATSSAPSAPKTAHSDTGEAPSDEDLGALRAMVFDTLKWPKERAQNWLKKHFGLASTTGLTKRQLRTSFELLFAHEQGADKYKEACAKALAEGLTVG